MNYTESQRKLIARSRVFLNSKFAINNPCNYLNTWANVPGYFLLEYWLSIWNFGKLFISISKSIIKPGYLNKCKLHYDLHHIVNDNLAISWCSKSDFDDKDLKYKDRYFNTKSQDSLGVTWLLISLDNFVPDNLESNVIIFTSKSKFSFKFLVKNIFESIFLFQNFREIFYEFKFVTEIQKCILNDLKVQNIAKVIFPYEAQVFQNELISFFKKINSNIITIGYMHSCLAPLMCDLFYRKGAPDKLFTHGDYQKKILNKYLDWPINNLSVVKSLRFKEELDNSAFINFIYLPYDFFKPKFLLSQIEYYLSVQEDNSLPLLSIRNHPRQYNSKKHLELIDKISILIEYYKPKFSDKVQNNLSLYIGSTAGIMESLERKVKVVNITQNPIFEAFSEEFWPGMSVQRINDYIYEYELKIFNKYIDFSDGTLSINYLLN